MAEPILDCPGVVAGVRQRVSAAVPQHVGMDQEVEAGALPNALDQAVDRIGRKWSVLLGLKHEAGVGKFPPQLSQCSDFRIRSCVTSRSTGRGSFFSAGRSRIRDYRGGFCNCLFY
jgi:hypothetical protein